ncbi:MAG: biotin--[acetyl-CoA-carboxylase] ligase [Clostridiales bacterium]|nr:biotin--[acetyl-CoA-carboxylase] ligase [Clostridiales bacterium]
MEITHFEKLDSTNEYAKRLEFNSDIRRAIVADSQYKGKGREKRKFVSDKGGLYFSIVIDVEFVPDKLSFITQITAAAIHKALKELGIDTFIKWPNDIILNRKKLAGILVESINRGFRMRIISGIGINVENDVQNIEDAASLKGEGFTVDKESLLGEIIKHFLDFYDRLQVNDIDEALSIIKQNSYILNKEILVHKNNDVFLALAKDISPDGSLIVEYKEGGREAIYSSGVQIRLPREIERE